MHVYIAKNSGLLAIPRLLDTIGDRGVKGSRPTTGAEAIMRQRYGLTCVALVLFALPQRADEPRAVEELAKSARSSVVVITMAGRDGKKHGLDTGFIVSADGLIATNLHVIGEGRPISVETAEGKRLEVTAIHASDRNLDLAVLRVNAKDLPSLELGDSEKLQDGQAVVALGNPHGLKNSVVAGVVSAVRPIDGINMIQLAIPLEAGNSGGPLLDMQGHVQGVLTMKSLVTHNLGFAMPVNALKTLLAKPNPVPIANWLTLGALDAAEWK